MAHKRHRCSQSVAEWRIPWNNDFGGMRPTGMESEACFWFTPFPHLSLETRRQTCIGPAGSWHATNKGADML